jgi:ankyrin repeat protein
VIQWLHAHGADLDMFDKQGGFPLLEASQMYETRMGALRALLEAGATVNRASHRGLTPLLGAATCGTAEKVKLLLAAGADPRMCNLQGHSAMHCAVAKDDLAIIRVLLDRGLHPDYCGAANDGTTALGFCVSVKAVQLLLDGGADVQKLSKRGMNCLHRGALEGAPVSVLCAMIAAGADPTLVSAAVHVRMIACCAVCVV